MANYSDIVRKLHGKIKIIYSDTDKSYELMVATSDNGTISYPNQVTEGYMAPSLKACTMDGLSTMGGGHQMIGQGFIMGWWSERHSNNECLFSEPYPYIEVGFISRPIYKWNIVGDTKLGQYPVDFDITLFDAESNVLLSVPIRGNNKVKTTINFDIMVVDVVKIKLEIIKWSHPGTKIKLLQFFDILEETYEGDQLKQFELLEELATDTEGVSYGINSDTLNVTIYNKERKFDQGYLKDLLLIDRKVTAYIGIEHEDGNIEYVNLGTFLSSEWNVPQDDQFVKLKCYDRLLKFQSMTYIGYPFTQNVSLMDLTKDVLLSAGLGENEFEIDNKLNELKVGYAFLGKQSVWDALQEICNAGLCRVFVNRDNKIKVTIENENVDAKQEIKPNRLFKHEHNSKVCDFSNYIEVNYTDISASDTETKVVYNNKISIDANSKRTMIVDYSETVKDAYISYVPINNIQLNYFNTSIDAGKFQLENLSNETIVVDVTIRGIVIQVSTQTVVVQDEDSVAQYGELTYTHPASALVQTYSRAIEIGEYLLRHLNSKTGKLSIKWRGDPWLMLEDKFICIDKFGNKKTYLNESNKFTFNGGLTQETKGKEIISNE